MDDGYENEDYQNDIVSEKMSHASEMSLENGGTALFVSSYGKWDHRRITFFVIYLLTIFSLIMANAAFVIAFLRCFPMCAFNWHGFQDKCYYYSRKQVLWEKARSTCQDLSADLVVIDSEKEQDFLVYNMKEKTSQWIGLRYTTKEMVWKWVDGTNASYTQWGPSKPTSKDEHDSKEDCVVMEHGNNHKWSNVFCDSTNRFICEKNMQLACVWQTFRSSH